MITTRRSAACIIYGMDGTQKGSRVVEPQNEPTAPEPADVAGERPVDAALEAALQAALGGDEMAFRCLYRDVQPRLLRYLRTMVGSDADDVASDAWLQIARDLGSFHGDYDRFRGWATKIARNRAIDHLRRTGRRPAIPLPETEFAELVGTLDTEADALERVSTDQALGLIATLPRDQAEAVLLRVVVGLDAKEAGRVLGKRPGAVRTSAYRGLRRLAEQLDERRDERLGDEVEE